MQKGSRCYGILKQKEAFHISMNYETSVLHITSRINVEDEI